MRLKYLELHGFKSFAKKTTLEFGHPIVSVVGPNGSGKSNVVEALRFVLGEQSMKSMRGKTGVDLIFKGSKSLSKGTKATVSVYFDNSDKVFKLSNEEGEIVELNYDTVSISREVYADGLNKYILNDSDVRLKDVNNLLSSVHIGSSGHHIISQGEADRVLNSTPKDLKEIVEDALGLKVYQFKIKEGVRKLERANENMKEVSILRRENAPHLNFLKKQVEKLEKVKEMKVELSSLYKEYLKKESVYLEEEKSRLSNDKNRIMDAIRDIVERMGVDEESTPRESAKLQELRTVETNLSNIRRLKNEIERKLGRIEGMIEIAETRREEAPEEIIISASEMKEIVHEVNTFLDEALEKENLEEIKNIIQSIKNTLSKFEKKPEEVVIHSNTAEVDALKDSQRQILFEMERIEQEDRKTGEIIKKLKEEIQEEVEKGMDKERERFTLKVKHQELSSELQLNNVKEENIRRLIESYEGEIREGEAFIGGEIYLYKEYVFEGIVDRGLQEGLRRRIERIKIKLEDAGLSNGADILKEFEEVTERDAFLAKEMEDLAKSIESLHQLIAELKEKIHIEFETGIKKINAKFHEFFALMFGGGEAALSIVFSEKRKKSNADEDEDGEVVTEEDEEEFVPEEGVAIDIALPHKKVKELHSLSGGERSLTSIALLFAMSAVNPPPFLVLDETDAALDEANSRKYGDMLEKLSEHSQLIVVTHNRETMSRAGVLYGVTIGSDGASKLLSVKFDEAAAIAK